MKHSHRQQVNSAASNLMEQQNLRREAIFIDGSDILTCLFQFSPISFFQVPLEQTWVAETYEPLSFRQDKKEMDYVVVNEDLLLTRYPNAKSLRRNLVGTIGLVNHRCAS